MAAVTLNLVPVDHVHSPDYRQSAFLDVVAKVDVQLQEVSAFINRCKAAVFTLYVCSGSSYGKECTPSAWREVARSPPKCVNSLQELRLVLADVVLFEAGRTYGLCVRRTGDKGGVCVRDIQSTDARIVAANDLVDVKSGRCCQLANPPFRGRPIACRLTEDPVHFELVGQIVLRRMPSASAAENSGELHGNAARIAPERLQETVDRLGVQLAIQHQVFEALKQDEKQLQVDNQHAQQTIDRLQAQLAEQRLAMEALQAEKPQTENQHAQQTIDCLRAQLAEQRQAMEALQAEKDCFKDKIAALVEALRVEVSDHHCGGRKRPHGS